MRIPRRFAAPAFGALLSSIMVAVVSGFLLLTTQGLHTGFLLRWLKSFLVTWPIAFATATLVGPWARKVVDRLVE